VNIPRAVLDDIIGHARAVRPLECCGMLIGHGERIQGAVRAANLAASSTRYLIDPRDHIRARRDARNAGQEVVGFYHSHPSTAPVPSPSDIAEASYPDCVWLIVGLEGAAPEARLFRITDGAATAVTLVVDATD
jgi:proteasome lid subunit RPN8/RPN11